MGVGPTIGFSRESALLTGARGAEVDVLCAASSDFACVHDRGFKAARDLNAV